MTKRKFYRTLIEVEVLSEKPLNDAESLDSVYFDITEGDCSGSIKVKTLEEVNGKRIAKLLQKQGSDPEFFQIDKQGNDLEQE